MVCKVLYNDHSGRGILKIASIQYSQKISFSIWYSTRY